METVRRVVQMGRRTVAAKAKPKIDSVGVISPGGREKITPASLNHRIA